MVTMSAFEVLGPVMVGPSSSHTAGALRIALVARSLAPQPLARVDFTLYNSFSRTHEGHGTDRALVAGILGLAPDDVRVRDSFALAREEGLLFSIAEGGADDTLHPNTVLVRMEAADGGVVEVMGESVGGGRVRISSIDGVSVRVTGELPTVFVAHRDRPGVLARLCEAFSGRMVNIAAMRTFRHERGGSSYTVFELDERPDQGIVDRIRATEWVSFASVVDVPGAAVAPAQGDAGPSFSTARDLLALCDKDGGTIGQVMRERELALSGTGADAAMGRVLQVMRDETHETLERPLRSLGGFLFGQAKAVGDASMRLAPALMGDALSRGVAYAMATLERSATMGVIVAAPTAGSAGVVPGAVLASAEALGANDEQIMHALWNAAAIGALVSTNATVAGAEGGCQAEVGAAAAMAASALVELHGGNARTSLHAAAIAIANLLGLVCDPARGMVEYPCQYRNAIGVSAAFSAAQLALSGVRSPVPFDEAVQVMAEVGRSLSPALRETAEGGLAVAPSICDGCNGCA